MSNHVDTQYLETLDRLITHGVRRVGRNGHMTFGLFGHQMRFDLTKGFPLLTTKKVHTKSVIVELLWFLCGDSNIQYLHDHGVTIWDEWADEKGELGPVYGKQWRSWPTGRQLGPEGSGDREEYSIDQIVNVLNSLRKDPFGRRHIVTAWNPAEVDRMALPPCHCFFQFNVRPGQHYTTTEDGGSDVHDVLFLDCQMYQRSADWFLGVPFNIASYALLTSLIARELSMVPGEFIHTFGDYHLYENHLGAAREQLSRASQSSGTLPSLWVKEHTGLFDLRPEDISLTGYNPMPAIKAEVAV